MLIYMIVCARVSRSGCNQEKEFEQEKFDLKGY